MIYLFHINNNEIFLQAQVTIPTQRWVGHIPSSSFPEVAKKNQRVSDKEIPHPT